MKGNGRRATAVESQAHQDEIAEAIANAKPHVGPHDFDGAEACGDWIMVERTGSQDKSQGGIVIPEAVQLPIWTVFTAGAKVEEKLGRKLNVGDRLLFTNPSATFVQDGRGFALLRWDSVVAVLRKPEVTLVTLAAAIQ